MKPSRETVETLNNITTEVSAGRVFRPRNEMERTWNNAHERVMAIIANYRNGDGLFQMTADIAQRKTVDKPLDCQGVAMTSGRGKISQ